jgi:hypothetical protein
MVLGMKLVLIEHYLIWTKQLSCDALFGKISTMESNNLVLILQRKLAAADAMVTACLSMIQSGQLDPSCDMARACFRYLQGAQEPVQQTSQGNGSAVQNVEAEQGPNEAIELVPIESYEETLMLPASLRTEFTEGFRFTLEGMRVCPGWRTDNANNNYCVEWAEFDADGLSGRATYDSQARIADRIAEQDKRKQTARQRARFVKQVGAELETVSPKLLTAANAVLEKNRSLLSEEGVAKLQAYIANLPGRLPHAAADLMLAGASLEDGMAKAVRYLTGQTQKRANVLSGLPMYRSLP